MLFFREFRLMIIEVACSRWRFGALLTLLLLSVLSLVYRAFQLQTTGVKGIPQGLELLFSVDSFIFPVLPLFLLFFAFGLLPFFREFRYIRYKGRIQVYFALISRIYWFVLLFAFLYLSSGVLISGIMSGHWENVWLTKEGTPYLIYGSKIPFPLQHYFSTKWMCIRYIFTSMLLFNMLSVLVTICYVVIPRYIYSFIIVSVIAILDKMLLTFYGFSLLNVPLSLEMTSWLAPGTFRTTVILFAGMWLTLLTILYQIMIKQDYFNKYQTDDGKNS